MATSTGAVDSATCLYGSGAAQADKTAAVRIKASLMVSPYVKASSIAPRIRGRKLQRIRAAVLQANPLCVMCEAQGIVALATEVDHIVALVNGGKDERDNLQGLCHECHADKTAADMGRKPRAQIGADGWPILQGLTGSRLGWMGDGPNGLQGGLYSPPAQDGAGGDESSDEG